MDVCELPKGKPITFEYKPHTYYEYSTIILRTRIDSLADKTYLEMPYTAYGNSMLETADHDSHSATGTHKSDAKQLKVNPTVALLVSRHVVDVQTCIHPRRDVTYYRYE